MFGEDAFVYLSLALIVAAGMLFVHLIVPNEADASADPGVATASAGNPALR